MGEHELHGAYRLAKLAVQELQGALKGPGARLSLQQRQRCRDVVDAARLALSRLQDAMLMHAAEPFMLVQAAFTLRQGAKAAQLQIERLAEEHEGSSFLRCFRGRAHERSGPTITKDAFDAVLQEHALWQTPLGFGAQDDAHSLSLSMDSNNSLGTRMHVPHASGSPRAFSNPAFYNSSPPLSARSTSDNLPSHVTITTAALQTANPLAGGNTSSSSEGLAGPSSNFSNSTNAPSPSRPTDGALGRHHARSLPPVLESGDEPFPLGHAAAYEPAVHAAEQAMPSSPGKQSTASSQASMQLSNSLDAPSLAGIDQAPVPPPSPFSNSNSAAPRSPATSAPATTTASAASIVSAASAASAVAPADKPPAFPVGPLRKAGQGRVNGLCFVDSGDLNNITQLLVIAGRRLLLYSSAVGSFYSDVSVENESGRVVVATQGLTGVLWTGHQDGTIRAHVCGSHDAPYALQCVPNTSITALACAVDGTLWAGDAAGHCMALTWDLKAPEGICMLVKPRLVDAHSDFEGEQPSPRSAGLDNQSDASSSTAGAGSGVLPSPRGGGGGGASTSGKPVHRVSCMLAKQGLLCIATASNLLHLLRTPDCTYLNMGGFNSWGACTCMSYVRWQAAARKPGLELLGWRLLTGHANGQALVWDVSQGRVVTLCALGQPGPAIRGLAVFHSLDCMVMGLDNGCINMGPIPNASMSSVRNPAGRVPVWMLQQDVTHAHSSKMSGFAATATVVATGSTAGGVKVWDVVQLKAQAVQKGLAFPAAPRSSVGSAPQPAASLDAAGSVASSIATAASVKATTVQSIAHLAEVPAAPAAAEGDARAAGTAADGATTATKSPDKNNLQKDEPSLSDSFPGFRSPSASQRILDNPQAADGNPAQAPAPLTSGSAASKASSKSPRGGEPPSEAPADAQEPPAPVSAADSAESAESAAARASSQVHGFSDLMAQATANHVFIPKNELRLIEEIGRGAEGTVWRGRWHHIDVAVKEMHPKSQSFTRLASVARDLSRNTRSQVLTAVMKEVQALIDVSQHPNIVRFIGVCVDPPRIVTEYYPLGSLFSIIQKAREGDQNIIRQLTWARRMQMLHNIAAGMAYLHSRNYVHGDLRSPNIFVGLDGQVKIGDFGFARALGDDDAGANSRTTNPRWLAPEVLREGRTSKPADVYSFSIIMWEMLTWQIPYTGYFSVQVMFNHVKDGFRPDIPPEEQLPVSGKINLAPFKALLQECWAQEPADRPNFEDVASRIMALMHWQSTLGRIRAQLHAGGAIKRLLGAAAAMRAESQRVHDAADAAADGEANQAGDGAEDGAAGAAVAAPSAMLPAGPSSPSSSSIKSQPMSYSEVPTALPTMPMPAQPTTSITPAAAAWLNSLMTAHRNALPSSTVVQAARAADGDDSGPADADTAALADTASTSINQTPSSTTSEASQAPSSKSRAWRSSRLAGALRAAVAVQKAANQAEKDASPSSGHPDAAETKRTTTSNPTQPNPTSSAQAANASTSLNGTILVPHTASKPTLSPFVAPASNRTILKEINVTMSEWLPDGTISGRKSNNAVQAAAAAVAAVPVPGTAGPAAADADTAGLEGAWDEDLRPWGHKPGLPSPLEMAIRLAREEDAANAAASTRTMASAEAKPAAPNKDAAAAPSTSAAGSSKAASSTSTKASTARPPSVPPLLLSSLVKPNVASGAASTSAGAAGETSTAGGSSSHNKPQDTDGIMLPPPPLPSMASPFANLSVLQGLTSGSFNTQHTPPPTHQTSTSTSTSSQVGAGAMPTSAMPKSAILKGLRSHSGRRVAFRDLDETYVPPLRSAALPDSGLTTTGSRGRSNRSGRWVSAPTTSAPLPASSQAAASMLGSPFTFNLPSEAVAEVASRENSFESASSNASFTSATSTTSAWAGEGAHAADDHDDSAVATSPFASATIAALGAVGSGTYSQHAFSFGSSRSSSRASSMQRRAAGGANSTSTTATTAAPVDSASMPSPATATPSQAQQLSAPAADMHSPFANFTLFEGLADSNSITAALDGAFGGAAAVAAAALGNNSRQ